MLRASSDGVTLAVRAQPGAKKTAITGVYGEGASAQLKVAVHAPPIEGRANEAIVEFLSDLFSRPRNAIRLVAGQTARSKVFVIGGISLAEAERILAEALRD